MSLLSKRFTCIDPGHWPARKGTRLRVLVEHPDRAQLEGARQILGDAGYDVAVCAGSDAGHRCPLVEFGSCALAEDADVVVTSTQVRDSEALLEAFGERTAPQVVVEVDADVREQVARLLPEAVIVAAPITAEKLRSALTSVRHAGL
jgi:AmiR/NasT family two-component response regulator